MPLVWRKVRDVNNHAGTVIRVVTLRGNVIVKLIRVAAQGKPAGRKLPGKEEVACKKFLGRPSAEEMKEIHAGTQHRCRDGIDVRQTAPRAIAKGMDGEHDFSPPGTDPFEMAHGPRLAKPMTVNQLRIGNGCIKLAFGAELPDPVRERCLELAVQPWFLLACDHYRAH